jgi:hypothetical protein
MIFVQCQLCGNVYGCPPRSVGGTCGVLGCQGTLRPHASVFPMRPRQRADVRLILQCPLCGNVYSSPPRKIWDKCGANGCSGLLDKK